MTSDQDIVDAAVAEHHAGHPITDGQARVIASQWHGGQFSALYTFASSGATVLWDDDWQSEDPLARIRGEITQDLNPEHPELEALLAYVERVGARSPVEGWSTLWGGW